MLARSRRSVVVIDSGIPRNAPADGVHGLLGHDGLPAVDDGQDALNRLLERLAAVTAPAGQTPREIGVPPTATLLPITPI